MFGQKNIARIAALALLAAALAGCARQMEPAGTPGGKPVAAVTIMPQKTFVEAVCGGLVEVVVMVPPGASPETYEPAPAQMQNLGAAAVYFAIGMPAEENFILGGIGENTKLVRLQNEVNETYAPLTFENGEADLHIWLSPRRVKVMAGAIAREMGALYPEHAETFFANAKAYGERLDALDAAIHEKLDGLAQRTFIAYHPAFGYFADDYGLVMLALEEEGKEATARHMQEVVDFAKTQNIRVIFYQEETAGRQAEAFAAELQGRAVMLSPLSAEYMDNLLLMADALREALQ